jgi:methionyl-tRNA formyltransferase
VVAYGKIIPKEILELPRFGCINVHASLLPAYRGAAPIHRAVINGDGITGVTTMHMGVGLDTGDMIYCTEVLISKKDTVGTVHDKLATAGAALIVLTLEAIKKGIAPRIPQDDSLATLAPLLNKADEELDWSQSATEIVNRVRGMNPFPGTFTLFRGEILKSLEVEADELAELAEPGTIITADVKKGILVACGKDAVWLKEVQAKSGKRMSGDAFVRGYKVSEGEILKR